jgi:hypothetical protein
MHSATVQVLALVLLVSAASSPLRVVDLLPRALLTLRASAQRQQAPVKKHASVLARALLGDMSRQ